MASGLVDVGASRSAAAPITGVGLVDRPRVRSKEGRQRQAVQAWLTQLIAGLHGRILSFNASVVHVWAEQEWELREAGQRMPVEDSYIAAIARRHNLTIVTGNDKHFRRPRLKVFNPFRELPATG